jgi:predicted DNA binding CopG/RHH family protein
MKQKISVRLDTEILQLAKQRAAKERRPLDELIQEALANYLRKFAATPEERKMAYQLFANDR